MKQNWPNQNNAQGIAMGQPVYLAGAQNTPLRSQQDNIYI